MRILIFGQRVSEEHLHSIEDLIEATNKENIEIVYFGPFLRKLTKYLKLPEGNRTIETHEDFKAAAIDVVISLGGDGTILSAVTLIRDTQVPILGINMGRLGFLASTEAKNAAQTIYKLARGMYTIEDRVMLYLETTGKLFEGERFALNDFTLHKRETSSMMTIRTYINGDFLTSYWADGLIVATPTGSTAYSLSCGGPIIFPQSGNFVITPVAPHNLNVRPIVVRDDSVISFDIEGRSNTYLATLDSRFEAVSADLQLAVRRCDFTTRIVLLDDFSFMKTIHDKLTWGADKRN
jgi:NAD+ kinase